MSTALTVSQKEKLATKMTKSVLYGTNPNVTLAKIIAGEELGFGPAASQSLFHESNGKLTFSSNALASLIKASERYDYEVIRLDDEVCHLKFYEEGRQAKDVKYTLKNAQDAGHITGRNKETWQKYRSNMLFARCVSNLVRTYCPDVTVGITAYTPEEFGGVEIDGVVIPQDVEFEEKPKERADSSKVTEEEAHALETQAVLVGADLEEIKKFAAVKNLSDLTLKAWRAVMKILNARPRKEIQDAEVSDGDVQVQSHEVGALSTGGEESSPILPDVSSYGPGGCRTS